MRKNKFKVWDKLRGKMAKQITTFNFDILGNINLVVYLDKTNKTKEITGQEKIYTNEFEIRHFTGLVDKNGKEIYEGDIVKYFGNYGAEGVDSSYELNIEVSYNEQLGAYEPFASLSDNTVCREDFEVIGNNYDNPELIK